MMRKHVTFDLTPIVHTAPSQVQVKALCRGELRRFTLETATCVALVCKLRSVFGVHPAILKYRDYDGDYITFSSDIELSDAVDRAPGSLRVLVIPASSWPPSPTPRPTPTPTPTPTSTSVQYQMPIYVAYTQQCAHQQQSTQSTPLERPFKPVDSSTRGMTRRPNTTRRQPRITTKSSSDPGRLLDTVAGAVGWMLLGAVLYHVVPMWLLFFAFIALHRRFSMRPALERELTNMMKKRQYSKAVTYHNVDQKV